MSPERPFPPGWGASYVWIMTQPGHTVQYRTVPEWPQFAQEQHSAVWAPILPPMRPSPFLTRLDQLADVLDATTYQSLLELMGAEIRLAIDSHRHGIALARLAGVSSAILERRLAELEAKLSTIGRSTFQTNGRPCDEV